MKSITVTLPDERLAELQDLADRLDVALEDLARTGIEELLRMPSEEFRRAMAQVLERNAELYRRLA